VARGLSRAASRLGRPGSGRPRRPAGLSRALAARFCGGGASAKREVSGVILLHMVSHFN